MTAYEHSLRVARRAYELARFRRGALRASGLAGMLGLASAVAIGGSALVWLPIFLAVWATLEWRGGALLRGGRIGALFGALVALVPSSLFMSCCRLGCSLGGGFCCSTSRACAAIGVVMGTFAAALLSRLPPRDRVTATIGAGLGIVATAIPRCAGLMVGEGLGLLLGLVAGTAAAGVVCVVIDRARQPA